MVFCKPFRDARMVNLTTREHKKTFPLISDASERVYSEIRFSDDNERLLYKGMTSSGVPDGNGTLLFKNGAEYTGSFHNGKVEGYGKWTYASNDEYDQVYYLGYYVNNQKSGMGKMVWKNGAFYDGEWKDGLRHGFAKESFGDGDSFEGYFENDYKSGNGTYKNNENSTSDYFVGTFKGGVKYGHGKQVWKNGYVYDGEWMDDKRHGFGTLSDSQGEIIYRGYWFNDDWLEKTDVR